jgi:uncharacterized Zn-binding protein involved in type VI secretion
MQPAARKGDPTIHLGIIEEGSPNVTIGGMPAARLLDKHLCPLHGPGPITSSSMTVYINGMGAARVLDQCTCMMPSTAAGEGNAKKEEQSKAKFSISPELKNEKKLAEKEWSSEKKEEGKDGEGEDGKKDGWKGKVAVEASKDFFKADNKLKDANGKDVDNYVQANAYEAKGTASAGAEFEGLRNATAKAGVKAQAEYAAVKAAGKLGDANKGLGEVSAEGKLFTGRAEAGAEANLEIKNGVVQSANVEGKVGAGVAVAEGKAEGKRSFRIPFLGIKVTVGGEVSGSVLSAQAEASAKAGLKKGKFSLSFGAKAAGQAPGRAWRRGHRSHRDGAPDHARRRLSAPVHPGPTRARPAGLAHRCDRHSQQRAGAHAAEGQARRRALHTSEV